jgi:hypothetical protein
MQQSGRAVYNFVVGESGSYVIQALIDAPTPAENSFFINVDSDPTDPLMIWDATPTSGFEKQFVSWRGNGTFDVDQFAPKVFDLTAGVHQLVILGREANMKLKTLQLFKLPAPPNNLHPTG